MQARRLRKALEHAIRSTVIQSRAAHYQMQVADRTHKLKHAATSIDPAKPITKPQKPRIGCDMVESQGNPLAGMVSSPMQQQKQQLPQAHADTLQLSQGLLSPGMDPPHVAWADQATAWPTNLLAASNMAEQASADLPDGKVFRKLEPLQSTLQMQSTSGGTHENALFEDVGGTCSTSLDTSQSSIAEFQKQVEASWESMQQELQQFKTDVLTQLAALQHSKAGKGEGKVRLQKGSTQLHTAKQ